MKSWPTRTPSFSGVTTLNAGIALCICSGILFLNMYFYFSANFKRILKTQNIQGFSKYHVNSLCDIFQPLLCAYNIIVEYDTLHDSVTIFLLQLSSPKPDIIGNVS